MSSSSSSSPPTTNPRPHQKIEHVTIIHAPIETVWKALLDVNDWSWNKWTKLEAGTPAVGLQGTLMAYYEGNDKDWQAFAFEFAEVDSKSHTLAWKGSVGPFDGCLFHGYHTMRLVVPSTRTTTTTTTVSTNAPNETKLIHTEVFGGLLPILRLGLPYSKLDRNYRLMNEALKEFVETKSQ